MIEEMCLSVSRGEFVMVHGGRSPEAAGEALSVSWRGKWQHHATG